MNKGPELTPDGFQILPHRSILIAASHDVSEQRDIVAAAVRGALEEIGEGGVEIKEWNSTVGPGGTDQGRSMQKNFYRPWDDNCLGVIYLVGERIGMPLEDSFDCGYVPKVDIWLSKKRRFRLEPKWPLNPVTQNKLLAAGAFPFTGGVFEFLAAWGAGKPVRLIVLAAEQVKINGPDPALNQQRWMLRETAGKNRKPMEEFITGDYRRQTQGVYNFLRATATREGIQQILGYTEDDLRYHARTFVQKVFKRSAGLRNPYKYLDYYDIHDESFPGREDFSKHVVRDLDERFADDQPAIIRLTGPSGCGKSSALRAGVLRRLVECSSGAYRVVRLRPEDFKDDKGDQLLALTVLRHEIAAQARLQLSDTGTLDALKRGASAPGALAALVSRTLLQNNGTQRVVLGLDQFEEIVDVLSGPAGKDWQPLVEFVNAAVATPNIGVIYTLESSRKDDHDRHLGGAFRDALEHKLDDESSGFLDDVIQEPFTKARFPLAQDVREELKANLKKLRRTSGEAVLPLLAMKLTQLFDFVQGHFAPRDVEARSDFPGATNTGGRITKAQLREKDKDEDLDFQKIVQAAAERAWSKAAGSNLDLSIVDFFLQPFVGIEGGKTQLTAAPLDRLDFSERKLANSFYEHRLMTRTSAAGGGRGLIRFVHEAVLEHWPAARAWRKDREPFLLMKATLRINAEHWDANGRPELAETVERKPAIVDQAAEVLYAYLRYWSLNQETIPARDRVFYTYLVTLFELSTTPLAPIPCYPHAFRYHAYLAAAYGLVPLLERFFRIDDACLDHPTANESGPNADGMRRPLCVAAWAHEKTVAYLLERGADPLATTQVGFSPIVAPLVMGNRVIFDLLIGASAKKKSGPDLEAALLDPSAGWTLLHWCAQFDRVDMAEVLINQYGFSANRADRNGHKPVHTAAASGSLAAFQFFAAYSDPGEEVNGRNCLELAAGAGKPQILDDCLYRPGLLRQPGKTSMTALHCAAEGLHSECIEILRNHSNPLATTPAGDQAIHLIFGDTSVPKRDDEDVVAALKALLAYRDVDVNMPGALKLSPLELSARYGEAQRLLLEHPAIDLAAGEHAGLFAAVDRGMWEVVLRFLSEHDIPGTSDRQGNNLLHHLAQVVTPNDLVDIALAGATKTQVNARNRARQTPLIKAIGAKNWYLVGRLLETGLSSTDFMLSGGLAHLLMADAPEGVIALAFKVNPDLIRERDVLRWNILHFICAHGNEPALQRLAPRLAGNADLWVQKDREKRRPIDLCRQALLKHAPKALKPVPWPRPKGWDFDIEWRLLSRARASNLLKRAKLELDNLAQLRIVEGGLPFYPGASIFRITSKEWTDPARAFYYLQHGRLLLRLKGTSPPIHEINKKLPLALSKRDALAYLRFFCFFVRGESGPFLILESAEQAEMPPEISAADRVKISAAAHPSWLIAEHENAFHVAAATFYGNAVFGAEYKIEKTGMIEMRGDLPVAVDLSCKIHRPLE